MKDTILVSLTIGGKAITLADVNEYVSLLASLLAVISGMWFLYDRLFKSTKK